MCKIPTVGEDDVNPRLSGSQFDSGAWSRNTSVTLRSDGPPRPTKIPPTTLTSKVRLARVIAVPPYAQVKALLQTSTVSPIVIEPNAHVAQMHKVRVANGVTEVPRSGLFPVLLSNFIFLLSPTHRHRPSNPPPSRYQPTPAIRSRGRAQSL